jgi:hypothetical protein
VCFIETWGFDNCNLLYFGLSCCCWCTAFLSVVDWRHRSVWSNSLVTSWFLWWPSLQEYVWQNHKPSEMFWEAFVLANVARTSQSLIRRSFTIFPSTLAQPTVT